MVSNKILGWEVLRGFYQAHRSMEGIDKTYGYFFNHPVASLNQQRLKGILDRCEVYGKGGRILDLCCGGGAIANFLALNGYQVVGIDVDPVEIGLANKARTWGPIDSVTFVAGNVENTIDEKEKFDIILLSYALHHVQDPLTILRLAKKGLKPNGVLLINEENKASPTFLTKHLVRSIIQKDTKEEHQWTYWGLRKLLKKAQFAICDCKGFDVIPLPTAFQWSLLFGCMPLCGQEKEGKKARHQFYF